MAPAKRTSSRTTKTSSNGGSGSKTRHKAAADGKKAAKSASSPKGKSSSAKRSPSPSYEVEEVRGHEFRGAKGNKSFYLVKWRGYPSSEATWEPEDNIDAHDLITAYWDRTNDIATHYTGV